MAWCLQPHRLSILYIIVVPALDWLDGRVLCFRPETITGSTACPAGYYCPQGAAEAIACPGGTYNPLERRSSVSDCMISKAGIYAEAGTYKEDGTGPCKEVRQQSRALAPAFLWQ